MQQRTPFLVAIAIAGVFGSAAALAQAPQFDAPPGPPRGHERFEHGARALPPGVKLSDEQHKQAFALRHAAEPQLFAQQARMRKAHEALRQLAQAPQFDEAKASAAANELGAASAASALLHARLGAQMAALLTPEQRADMARRPPEPGRP